MPEKPKTKPRKRGKSSRKPERDAPAGVKQQGTPGNFWLKTENLRWVFLPILSIVISILLFPNILSKSKEYKLSDIAERDIKASRSYLIENKELTEQNREKAVKQVLSVYDLDKTGLNLGPRIKEAFEAGRAYHAELASSQESQEIQTSDEQKPAGTDTPVAGNPFRVQFFEILEIPPDEPILDTLIESGFPAELEVALVQLITGVLEKGIVDNRERLSEQIERRGIVLHEIYSKEETTVGDGTRFYDLPEAKSAIENQKKRLENDFPSKALAAVSVKLTQSLLRPNLTFNQRETESRKDEARKSVKPIYFKVKKGEMLVREGERIEPDHLLKLSEQTKAESRIALLGRVPGMAVLIGFMFVVVYLVGMQGIQSKKMSPRDLIFNSIALMALFLFVWAYTFVADELARGFYFLTPRALLFAMPVAFGAMLVSVFQGLTTAVAFSLAGAVLASLMAGGQVEFFIYYFINSLLAAYIVRDFRERGLLIKAGLLVGLLNIFLSLSIQLVLGSVEYMDTVIAAGSGFVGGVLAGFIATGILPLAESSFGFTTDIKLLELANLDQPLLRDLMVQAPGTYHHSMITANMVEATAKAVNANPLLAKVSAYYHDIGKMKKPLYFIENQMGNENKHEKLAPSMSGLILTAHVKEGLELGKKHKLGMEIIDIVQQHHGTSLISYFYQKAKDRTVAKGGKETDVKEEDFRYPGPKPQTKEAGLVMLADMTEAASRSLRDPTPARVQGMVQKIINRAFSDGQLDECELTLKDLHEIAKSFNKTLSGIFHYRIEYPDQAPKNGKKGKNGYTDQVSAEDSGAKPSDDKAEDENGLRRLGLT